MGESKNSSYGGGAGGVAQNIFLVHMTMSTGSLASPPPRGGDSRRMQIFAPKMPVFSLAAI